MLAEDSRPLRCRAALTLYDCDSVCVEETLELVAMLRVYGLQGVATWLESQGIWSGCSLRSPRKK
jgi:hypothetical protein